MADGDFGTAVAQAIKGRAPLDVNGKLAAPVPPELLEGSTEVGRDLLAAADADAARAAIGAGTSDLALGTGATDAKPGDYQPAWGDVTSKPAAIAAGASQAEARDAIAAAGLDANGKLAATVLPAATEAAGGAVELASTAEATTGTDTAKAVTPAGLKAVVDGRAPLDANGRLDAPVPPELLEGSTALGRSLLSVTAPSLTYNRSGETEVEAQIRAALSALGLIHDDTVEAPEVPLTLAEVLLALEPLYLLTLDEPSGDFMDATSSGHDGTPMGSLSRSQPSLVPSDSEGKSVLLDGASGYISMPSGAGVAPAVNPAQGAFSLAFTIQASPTTGDRVYYEGNTANSGASFNFLPSNTTNLQVQFRDDGGTFILNGTPITTADVLDGNPHLVVFTYDDGTATWWVDGVEAGDATVTPPSGNVLLDDDLTAAPLGSNPTSYLQSAWDATVSSVTMDRASVVQDGANRFIRVQYPQGITGATNSGASWRAHFAGSMEATARYRVRFDSGFDWTEGGKLPGLAGGSSPSGGNPATDGFSARYMWKPNGGLIVYLYHSEQPGDYGQAFNLNQSLARNTWHTLEQRIVMNTPGQANGSLEVWVNNEKKLNKTDLKWRLSGDNWLIDSFYFSTFHGGTGAAYQPNRNNHADFDDFLITSGGAATFTAPRVTWGAFGRTNVTDFLNGGLDTLAGFPRALTGPEVASVYEAWTA